MCKKRPGGKASKPHHHSRHPDRPKTSSIGWKKTGKKLSAIDTTTYTDDQKAVLAVALASLQATLESLLRPQRYRRRINPFSPLIPLSNSGPHEAEPLELSSSWMSPGLTALGWTARIGLEEGIRSTYAWFLKNEAQARLG
ncbi:hypothetical protein [Desulforhabdus amnigena]|uniref:Uncharacterized protein n=1 Tax=Desulforhabdus amnigena TaxID=40218 RepID=A0A9W6FWX0_9BACT|nr:hypothetical protein [Desulforhabdus amnigena]GLI36469.1 hypothetical protein DAMNIGENAA_39020 [Desulforhabdus amnigena]